MIRHLGRLAVCGYSGYDAGMQVNACGCVPYRTNAQGAVEVLMILRRGGFWEFPKGKQEEGETDQETALRELREETNLHGELDGEHPIDIAYTFTRGGVRYEKTVRMFLCHVSGNRPVICEKRELNDATWLPLEESLERATYPQMKDVARTARTMLERQ